MTKPPKKFEAIAYHEAGHAVAAWRTGVRIKALSIVPQDDTDGRMTHVQYFKGQEVEASNSEATRRRIENMAIVCCAGGWAQRRFHPRSQWRIGTQGDYAQCEDLLSRLVGYTDTAQAYFNLIDLQARDLIYGAHNWPLVEVLAAALIDQQEMTGKQVRETLIEAERHAR